MVSSAIGLAAIMAFLVFFIGFLADMSVVKTFGTVEGII